MTLDEKKARAAADLLQRLGGRREARELLARLDAQATGAGEDQEPLREVTLDMEAGEGVAHARRYRRTKVGHLRATLASLPDEWAVFPNPVTGALIVVDDSDVDRGHIETGSAEFELLDDG